MTVLKFGYCYNKKWYAIFGRLIQLFERLNGSINASHCYVDFYEDVINPKKIYRAESVFPYGRLSLNKDHSNKYKNVAVYSFIIDKDISEVIRWVELNIVGKKYSFSQNIALAALNLLIQSFNLKKWTWLERIEFNGRVKQNCTEAQVMMLAHFLNIIPTEGYDNFSVSEAHDLVKSIWILKGMSL